MLNLKIKSLKKLGKSKTVDLEVDHPDHNFYANGICTSNSHANSYAQTAAMTVYLKFKHPKEFFLALLRMCKYEPDSHKEIHKICRELNGFNIELLPPDLERSDIDFKIEGENIRYGLSMIKGVSENTFQALIDFRDSDKPNKYDIFLSAKEAGINIGVLSSLIQAGVLPNYKQKRSRLVLEAQAFNLLTDREKRNIIALGEKYDYDLLNCIKDCVDNQIVGDDNRPIIKSSRFETFKKKYERYKEIFEQNSKYENFANWYFENNLLGYAISTKLIDVFDDSFDDSSKFEELRPRSFAKFVCIVDECTNSTSKNGNKYIRLDLKDEVGGFSALLVDNSYEDKCTKYINSGKKIPESGDVVVLRGTKGDDVLFIDQLDVMTTKIYMKLSELNDE